MHPSERMASNFGTNRENCARERKGNSTLISMLTLTMDLPILELMSSFTRLRWVTARILLLVHNCRASKTRQAMREGALKTDELVPVEERWISSAQQTAYFKKLNILRAGKEL